MKRFAPVALALLLFAATPAEARRKQSSYPNFNVGLGVGVGYWFGGYGYANDWNRGYYGSGQVDLNVRFQWNFSWWFSFGLRPGVLLNLTPHWNDDYGRHGVWVDVGIPLDVYLRFFHSKRVYADLIGGLVIMPMRGDFVRAHVGIGVNGWIIQDVFSLGGEVAYLQNSAQVLFRLAWTF